MADIDPKDAPVKDDSKKTKATSNKKTSCNAKTAQVAAPGPSKKNESGHDDVMMSILKSIQEAQVQSRTEIEKLGRRMDDIKGTWTYDSYGYENEC